MRAHRDPLKVSKASIPNPILEALGFGLESRAAIFHADDIGLCHGANVAFEELSRSGMINSGSVMVPCPWFTEVAEMGANNPRLDLGVHLTLTSEWTAYRWAPISTINRKSGLIDENGYFWRRLPMLARNVAPEAAEAEMRAQIDRAISAGIDVTHLDTHMGAAILPQLLDIYVRLGREYGLPVLLPRLLSEYTSVLDFKDIPLMDYDKILATLKAEGWFLIDHFRMTPWVPTAESEQAYRDLVTKLPKGLTLIALHPNKSGDIEAIVPAKAHFRTDEYRLLSNPTFRQFVGEQGIGTIGFRPIRDLLRQKMITFSYRKTTNRAPSQR